MKRIAVLIPWLLAAAGLASVSAAAWPQGRPEPVADAAAGGTALRESVVMSTATVDGLPVRVHVLVSPTAAADTLVAQLRLWRRRPATPVALAVQGDWLIASRMTGEGFETLQLRDLPDGGSTGYRSVWLGSRTTAPGVGEAPAARAAGPAPDADGSARNPDGSAGDPSGSARGARASGLLPHEARVLRVVESRDGGRRATTTVASIGLAPWPALRLAAERLGRAGWTADSTPVASPAVADGRASEPAIVWLRRPGQALLLTAASRPGGSALMAHWMEEGR